MQPYSIIGSPFEVYVGPTATAFPDIDAEVDVTPPGWTLLGVNGTRSQSDDGVTVTHDQTVNEFRAAGSTGPMKAFRTEESLTVAGSLADLTVEAYSNAMNQATITTVAAAAGVAGEKSIGLSRGFLVVEFAVLIRGVSPYDEDMVAQYEVPRAYDGGSPAPQFTKGVAAMLAFEFHALEDPDATTDEERFGRFRAQTAAATS